MPKPSMMPSAAIDEFDMTVDNEVVRVLSDQTPPVTPPSINAKNASTSKSHYETLPFDPIALGGAVDLDKATFMVVPQGQAYDLILSHVAKNLIDASWHRSFVLNEKGEKEQPCCSPGRRMSREERKKKTKGGVAAMAGFGLHMFLWQQSPEADPLALHCLRQYVGSPVGTNCGPSRLENLILFSEGLAQEATLKRLVDDLVAVSEATEKDTFTVFQWHIKYQYWQKNQTVRARPLESVVLPRSTKETLCKDIDSFVSEDNEEFYFQHGIPYKRSYLFHGLPGSGKTSLIQALAGHYARNLCFLQPTHPEMTDDSLRAAVNGAPQNSIIVFEDIDALFDKDRGKKIQQSPLTFSGLLNALDGVGNPQGQIFILTTNFRDQLDAALIRNGRVDLHVEFGPTVPEQMEDMFRAFYPGAEASLATCFVDQLLDALEDRKMSTAVLQHYFVGQRLSIPEEAVANVSELVAALDERVVDAKSEAEAAQKNDKGGGGKGGGGKGGGRRSGRAPNATSGQDIHVHIHTPGAGSTAQNRANGPHSFEGSEEEEEE